MVKERRVFGLGTTYIQITGAEKNPRNWSDDEAQRRARASAPPKRSGQKAAFDREPKHL